MDISVYVYIYIFTYMKYNLTYILYSSINLNYNTIILTEMRYPYDEESLYMNQNYNNPNIKSNYYNQNLSDLVKVFLE